jgi:hypothetical protein
MQTFATNPIFWQFVTNTANNLLQHLVQTSHDIGVESLCC